MNTSSIKLVLAGPVGAGKSTAIRSIADEVPVSTEVPMSSGPMGEKTTTTVALDFATVYLDDDQPLLVYGLPGQEHFDFMRGIVLEGAFGVILVLDGSDPDIVGICEHWVRALRALQESLPMVIGITHTEAMDGFDTREVQAAARRAGAVVPIFTFDARERDQTSHLVRVLLVSMQ